MALPPLCFLIPHMALRGVVFSYRCPLMCQVGTSNMLVLRNRRHFCPNTSLMHESDDVCTEALWAFLAHSSQSRSKLSVLLWNRHVKSRLNLNWDLHCCSKQIKVTSSAAVMLAKGHWLAAEEMLDNKKKNTFLNHICRKVNYVVWLWDHTM